MLDISYQFIGMTAATFSSLPIRSPFDYGHAATSQPAAIKNEQTHLHDLQLSQPLLQ
jgi:hypothetical protein